MAKRLWISQADVSSLGIEQLRKIVERHQRIFNSGSGYGFWDWDMRTQHFDWSGQYWLELGYSDEDAHYINNSMTLPQLIHPEDREGSQLAIVKHLKNDIPLDITFRVRTKSGDYRWSQCLADSVRDDSGRVVYLSGINIDITQLKEVEEATARSHARQMRIINAAYDGIWEWSVEDNSFFYSKSCLEPLGIEVTENDDSRGMNQFNLYRDHVLAEDRPLYDLALRKHLKQEAPYDVEYRMRTKNNEIIWIRSKGQAVFNDEGRAIRMSGTNTNITELKEAEEKVIQAKEAAEKANQAKSQFLSSMSHELRTPLNSILGFAQLFDYESDLTSSQRENVREIRKAGQHLLQLINDVLDLAKIESGNITLSLEPVLPVRIAEECIGLLQSLADSRKITLRLETQGFDKIFVHADAVRLKQVLLNLINNGIKYNRDGGSVTVLFSACRDQTFTIQVRDTGYGIPESMHAAVFEPFNRLGAEESGTEGSGVGLVITKQLVEMMDGRLTFYSELGEGTCFEVVLKQSKEWTKEAAESAKRTARQPAATQLTVNDHKRILYIEDNASNLRLMEQLLQRFSQLTLITANEAFKGLYKARTEKPDLIILDINLPGMDGFEILKVLKQDPSTTHIPVVALSANAMNYDVERGLQAGFQAYLTKPVIFDELIGALNQWLSVTLSATETVE